MIEGVMRHCTEMQVDRQYVDSKGQSEVGFAFCYLLGFDLLPRLKGIASQKLYRPVSGRADDYPHLQDILTRPINWELIRQQYDEMMKFATAPRRYGLERLNRKRFCVALRAITSNIPPIKP